jgi:hypothetical protein
LRVGMPAAALMAGTALLAGATAWLTPLALVPIVLLSVAVMVMLRRVMPGVDQQWAGVRSSQRMAGGLLGGALASVVPLRLLQHLEPSPLPSSTMRKRDGLLNVGHLPCLTCLLGLPAPWRRSAS